MADLRATFESIIAEQSPDWCDMRFVLILPNEDRLDEARLAMAPTQLERTPGTRDTFTFRVSRERGYGAYVPLAADCLGRLDSAGIAGAVQLDRVVYDADPNLTQGVRL